MIDVQHLDKVYQGAEGPIPILSDLSLSLGRGEAAAIMGPSGSGKSSLLYILGTLDRPTAGSVRIDGADPFVFDETRLAGFRNRTVGFMFQDHCLLPQCTVIENVLAPTLVAAPVAGIVERARALLERVGLGHRLHHRPAALSGGERQRAALARALINRPRILLCDEPTGNLDHRSSQVVADLLTGLQGEQQTTLVVVTHSHDLARRLPRRYELVDGRLEPR